MYYLQNLISNILLKANFQIDISNKRNPSVIYAMNEGFLLNNCDTNYFE